jgi:hypothetical protein
MVISGWTCCGSFEGPCRSRRGRSRGRRWWRPPPRSPARSASDSRARRSRGARTTPRRTTRRARGRLSRSRHSEQGSDGIPATRPSGATRPTATMTAATKLRKQRADRRDGGVVGGVVLLEVVDSGRQERQRAEAERRPCGGRPAAWGKHPVGDGVCCGIRGSQGFPSVDEMCARRDRAPRLAQGTKLETARSNVAAWSSQSEPGAAATTTALERGPATRHAISRYAAFDVV